MLYFTPLEQFDEVVWLSHRVIETLEPYVLFISEIEFGAGHLYSNVYETASSSVSSFTSIFQVESEVFFLILFVLVSLSHFAPTIMSQLSLITEGFSLFFFLAAINVFTGFFIRIWFTDFFFATNEVISSVNTGFNFVLAPQIDFSFSIDEIMITLILGFFLVGGIEDNDDFIMSNNGDLIIVEDIVAPLFVANLGKDVAENGALYLKVCSIFSFVLISNLLGMIPYGDTATSSLILTFWVALSVFAALVTLMVRKHGINYFFNLFIPSGCPFALIFILIPIEFLSYTFRLVSLSVRLFANIMAGHTLRKVLIGFSYVRFTLGDGFAIAAFLPALVVFILIFLEIGVAAIQAYIFTILTCIYLKDLYVAHLLSIIYYKYLFKMPQLDIDLLEDFLFFAFAALLLGFGDEDSEENVIESSSDAYLAQYYLSKQKSLSMEAGQVSASSIFTKLK